MVLSIYRNEAGAVVLRGHSDVIHDMRFIPEPEVLLTVSSDKDMRAWRLNDYTCAAIYRYLKDKICLHKTKKVLPPAASSVDYYCLRSCTALINAGAAAFFKGFSPSF